MKRFLFISLIFLQYTQLLVAQDSKLSLGLQSSIDLNRYYFKDVGFDYEYNPNLGYSFGLVIQYFVFDKAFINSGLNFTSQGYKLKYNMIVREPGDPAIPRESDFNVSYLKIPIAFGYTIVNKEAFRFNPSVGIDLNFLISDKENTIYEDDSERESDYLNQNINKTPVNLSVNFGLEYHINQKFKILLEPYVAKGLNKLDNEAMKTGQISYGAVLGFYLIF